MIDDGGVTGRGGCCDKWEWGTIWEGIGRWELQYGYGWLQGYGCGQMTEGGEGWRDAGGEGCLACIGNTSLTLYCIGVGGGATTPVWYCTGPTTTGCCCLTTTCLTDFSALSWGSSNLILSDCIWGCTSSSMTLSFLFLKKKNMSANTIAQKSSNITITTMYTAVERCLVQSASTAQQETLVQVKFRQHVAQDYSVQDINWVDELPLQCMQQGENPYIKSEADYSRKEGRIKWLEISQVLPSESCCQKRKSSALMQPPRTSILKHSRIKSSDIGNFKQKLQSSLRLKVQLDEDRLRTQTALNRKARSAQQTRLSNLKQTIHNFRNAQAQYFRHTLDELKRQSLESQNKATMKRLIRRQPLSATYNVSSIASKNVQRAYIDKMEKEERRMGEKVERMRRLLEIKGNLDKWGLEPHITWL